MTEIDRAEKVADNLIEINHGYSIWNEDVSSADEGFQELVIQHLRLKGYKVIRDYCEWDGLQLKLIKEGE